MSELKSTNKWPVVGLIGVLALGLILAMTIVGAMVSNPASAHDGDASLVHACVNQTTAEVRIAHPGPGDENTDCAAIGPDWINVHLDEDWLGVGTGSLFNMADNVGIGTNTPTQKLQVIGTVDATSFTQLGSNTLSNDIAGNAATATALALDGSNCLPGNYPLGIDASGNVQGCALDIDTTYISGLGLSLIGTEFSVDTTSIQSRVSGGCTVGSSIRAINEDGTVTCETDDVGAGISGSGTAGRMVKFLDATTIGDSALFEDAGGHIGIRTTAPGARIEIGSGQNGANDVAFLISDFNNDAATFAIKINDENTGASVFHLRSDAGGDVNGGIDMYVSGNVGIGTDTPAEKLEVVGNIKLSGNITSDGEICIGSGC